jgi:tungstate transport system ATP-binding protein
MVAGKNLVALRAVCVKRRSKLILGPVSLDLKGSGLTIVLGPNGAGKTTFLKVLHGIERISSGSVQWSMADRSVRRTQSYVFQRPVMLRRTVRQNLAYPMKLLGQHASKIDEHVIYWANQIGLTEMLNRPATRLSGGEKQKLALGRALIRKPKILFLDEPCANLDGRSTREIETLLLSANSSGTRIIMATHDLGQSRRLATDVVFLLNGQVHEHGPAEDILCSPQTSEAKAFLKGEIVE